VYQFTLVVGIVSALAGIGSFWVAIKRYRREVPQKQLSYRTKTSADNQNVTIYTWNSGNSVIDPEDYVSPIGYNFGDVQIRESFVVEQAPEDLGVEATVLDSRKLELAPLVLNPKDSFTLRVRTGETESTVNPRPYGRIRREHQLFMLREAEREIGKPASPSGLTYAAFGTGGSLLLLPLVLITIQSLYAVLVTAHISHEEALQLTHSNFLDWYFHWANLLFAGTLLIAGGWLRTKLPQNNLKSYIAFGLFVGVVNFAGVVFLEFTMLHPPYRTAQDDLAAGIFILEDIVRLVLGLGYNLAAITILFVSGGTFGGLIDAWRSKRSITENATISKKVVEKFVSRDRQLFYKVVKFLIVLYPLTLLFIGMALVGRLIVDVP